MKPAAGASILTAALATRKGPLSLPNLTKISPKTLTALIPGFLDAIPHGLQPPERPGRDPRRRAWQGAEAVKQLRFEGNGCFAGVIRAYGPNRRSWLPPFCQSGGSQIPAVELIFAAFFRVLDVGGGFG
jgi:hypothetical protein